MKAMITNIDEGQTFNVQFNPKEFKLDEKANWKASDEHQKDKPLLTYEKGEPSVLTVDLVFDSTDGGDVYSEYVKPLRAFLTADVQKSDGQGNQMTRPPYLVFTWGSFSFPCVCEKLSSTFLMFSTGGTPIRAKVQLALKEREKEDHGSNSSAPGVVLSVGPLAAGGSGSAAYVTQPGDNLNKIASKTAAKPGDIALANNIADPMDIAPGQRLVIPANEAVAQVLAAQSRRRQPGNWQTAAAGGSGPRARGGYFGSVPSAFDETPPVALDYSVRPGGIADPYESFGPMDYTVRDDSQSALGTAGQGIGLGASDADSDAALHFRNDATPDEGFTRAQMQDYGVRGDSQSALGTAGKGIGMGASDTDSEGSLGTAGQGIGLGASDADSDAARSFRNDATPDEGFARAKMQDYSVREGSEGSIGTAGQGIGLGASDTSSDAAQSFRNDATPDEGFARAKMQDYAVRDGSQSALGSAGQGIGMGASDTSSDSATGFHNTATPDEGFARAKAQSYGGFGESQSALGSAGQGTGMGASDTSSDSATGFRNDATPDQGFAKAHAQSYGGYGESGSAVGSGGQGAEMGGHYGGSGEARGFRNDATPDAVGFNRAQGQNYGGYGESSNTLGSAGEGSEARTWRPSDDAGGSAGDGVRQGGTFYGRSDDAGGSAGDGVRQGGTFYGRSGQADDPDTVGGVHPREAGPTEGPGEGDANPGEARGGAFRERLAGADGKGDFAAAFKAAREQAERVKKGEDT